MQTAEKHNALKYRSAASGEMTHLQRESITELAGMLNQGGNPLVFDGEQNPIVVVAARPPAATAIGFLAAAVPAKVNEMAAHCFAVVGCDAVIVACTDFAAIERVARELQQARPEWRARVGLCSFSALQVLLHKVSDHKIAEQK